ncbi:MAG: NAD(P)/FAD-dependent oxidoreductase [Burkholderiales bacterium]|nr:NAD(P)/FAD-dependent oxidoreductase [Burkholderiales bacterium]
MSETVECTVIGAGVVGLAIARALARRGVETIVVEAETAIGTGTSSRNSEVIHAGIYYPAGSLKARFCVAGRGQLYRYCAERGITARRCGKLIVATEEAQVRTLAGIIDKARANGVDDLALLSGAEARALEPNLACVAAVHSPSTGVIDSHGFMLGLQGDFEAAGGMLAFGSPVVAAACRRDGITLEVGGAQPMAVRSRMVVNSAGLHAQALAARFDGLPPASIPPAHFAKGNYYALTGPSPFSRLIYPVPEAAGLGVHLTIDLGGQTRFGPDVEWIERIDYSVDPGRAAAFYAEIRKYWPGLPDGALSPGYCGIRPKIQAPHEAARDFLVQGPADHGVDGLVNLYGIESPGLTSALAIGDHVADLLRERAQ